MIEDYQEAHRRKTARVRSFMDYAMGIVLITIGVFFLVYDRFGIELTRGRPHSELDYVIGGVFTLYGAWRIYRGYKKDYFR